MQFNSIEFMFCFLPLFLAVYYVCPRSWRNPVLLFGSFAFYAFSCRDSLWQLALLAVLTVATYLAGRLLEASGKGWALGVYLAILLGILTFFKLYDGGRQLPVGMSFYLFQMAAYIIDIFRRKLQPEKNFIAFGAQSIMPASRWKAEADHYFAIENINGSNARIEALAEEEGYIFSNTNQWVMDENGYMREDMTYDGSHPKVHLYPKWSEAIQEDAGWYGIP